ncbi:MAG: anti-sigma factor [Pseudanabaenaceae cyanobacterium bins.68]|nr:anti-sigma factor [Pseudanabaenaceae cyanobacterium bins.68]
MEEQELYAGHALDQLNEAETAALLAALAQQPELEQELIAYEQTWAAIALTSPTPPPPYLKQRILSQATKPARQLRAVSFVGVITAAILGIYSLSLRQELQLRQAQIAEQKSMIAMLEQPKLNLVALKGMDKAPQATANLVSTPGEPKALLFVQNLPPLPPGQAYVVWAESQGKKIGCGSFRPNADGRGIVVIAVPNSQTDALIITQEASEQTTQPQGPMVMSSSI